MIFKLVNPNLIMKTAYFIAFKVEPSKQILEIQKKLKSYNVSGEYTKEDQFHITLNYLGKTCSIKKIKGVFNNIKKNFREPIEVSIDDVDFLSDARYGHSIACKVKENEHLKRMHEFLKQKLESKSLFEDFKPHITLTRTNEEVVPLPRANFRMLLKDIVLYKADIKGNDAIYTELYTVSLDKFEQMVWQVLEELKGLRRFKDIETAILYGSTALGKIKKPVHDIDLYLVFNTTIVKLETLKKIKKYIQNICKKYSDKETAVTTWAVGLGRVFEEQKIVKKKFNLGIEIYMIPASNIKSELSLEQIKFHRMNPLFGSVDMFPKERKHSFRAEATISRVVWSNLYGKVDYLTYYKQLYHSYVHYKREKGELEIPYGISFKDLVDYYLKITGCKEQGKDLIIEYPEFVLKGKRNFVYFVDIRNSKPKLKINGYLRHAYHNQNLLFLESKPLKIKDYLLYPYQQNNFMQLCPFFAYLLSKCSDQKELDFSGAELSKERFLSSGTSSFSYRAGTFTIPALYYMLDIKKNEFIFWYASLATIAQTSFAYLLTKGVYETNTSKILDKIKGYDLLTDKEVGLIKMTIKIQKVANVEKLYQICCNFLERMGNKLLEESKQQL